MKKNGFTLIEVLVAMGIMGFICMGIYAVLSMGSKTYNTEVGLIDLQQEMRRAADAMTREMRGASKSNITVNSSNVTFNTMDDTNISYYLSGSKIYRNNGTTPSVLASSITGITFSPSPFVATDPIVTININGSRNVTILGRPRMINSTYQQKVRLRND